MPIRVGTGYSDLFNDYEADEIIEADDFYVNNLYELDSGGGINFNNQTYFYDKLNIQTTGQHKYMISGTITQSDRNYYIKDMGSDCDFVFSNGSQVVRDKTFINCNIIGNANLNNIVCNSIVSNSILVSKEIYVSNIHFLTPVMSDIDMGGLNITSVGDLISGAVDTVNLGTDTIGPRTMNGNIDLYGNLKLMNIGQQTTGNIIYYNSSTRRMTFGAVPTTFITDPLIANTIIANTANITNMTCANLSISGIMKTDINMNSKDVFNVGQLVGFTTACQNGRFDFLNSTTSGAGIFVGDFLDLGFKNINRVGTLTANIISCNNLSSNIANIETINSRNVANDDFLRVNRNDYLLSINDLWYEYNTFHNKEILSPNTNENRITLANGSSIIAYHVCCSGSGEIVYRVNWTSSVFLQISRNYSKSFTTLGILNSFPNKVCCSASGKFVYYTQSTSGTALKSVDFGNTFTSMTSLGSNTWIDINCSKSGKFVVVSNATQTFLSKDFGATWTNLNLNINGGVIKVSYNGNVIVGMSVQSNGLISVSTNGGASFTSVKATLFNYFFKNFDMSIDGQYIILVEVNFSLTDGNTYFSSNYGSSWTTVSYPFTMVGYIPCISFDGKSGYIGTWTDHIVSFSNYGTTTNLFTPTTTYRINYIACNHDASILYADTDTAIEYQWISTENNYNKAYFWNGIQIIGDGNVSGLFGVGMTPTFKLDIRASAIRVDINGLYSGGFDTNWNVSGGVGESLFYNHRGGGAGAFYFKNKNTSGSDVGWANITGGTYTNASDRRIKKNIATIEDNYALEKLRLIEPKTYNYISDDLPKETVIGFIAQEVQAQLPEAISIISDFIPNIYKNCNVEIVSGNCVSLNLSNDDISSSNLSIGDLLRLQSNLGDLNFVVSNIAHNLITGTIDQELVDVSSVFVYGKKVDDFHLLNKPYLFTLNFSATQELDRKVSRLEQENLELRNEIQIIKNILGII